jgi:hypothetical protein
MSEEESVEEQRSIDVDTPEGALQVLALWAGEKEMNRQLGLLREKAIGTLHSLVTKDGEEE